jgi:tRNA(His) 5'-end guanylyltransferase
MQDTMKYLCQNIQGCVLGYTQSDEITLILVDYQTLTSGAWFDYEVQKMCSISAGMATMAFNKAFTLRVNEYIQDCAIDYETIGTCGEGSKEWKYSDSYCKSMEKGATFDSRCFNIPKEEVTNLIYWRQLDATRNSIQMVGQANFSHAQLQGKSCNDIQDMLMLQKGINWNDFPVECKRGTCCIKTNEGWIVDKEIPIFKGEDREYIDKLIKVGE